MPFDLGGFGQDVGLAAISGGLDALGAGASARSQYHFQKRLYKHRYQWEMADMKKAGLNPMLAFSQGAPSAGSVSAPDYSSVGSRATSAYMASRMNRAQIENIGSSTVLNAANAKAAGASADKDAAIAEFTRTQKDQMESGRPYWAGKEREQYWKIAADARAAANIVDNLAEQVLMSKQQRIQNEQIMPLLVQYQKLVNKAKELEIPEMQATADMWEAIGDNGKILDKLFEMIPGAKQAYEMYRKARGKR